MNSASTVLWSVLLLAGVALMIVGVRLRRTDQVRSGVPGNAVVLIGIALVVGGGAGLRQELAR